MSRVRDELDNQDQPSQRKISKNFKEEKKEGKASDGKDGPRSTRIQQPTRKGRAAHAMPCCDVMPCAGTEVPWHRSVLTDKDADLLACSVRTDTSNSVNRMTSRAVLRAVGRKKMR